MTLFELEVDVVPDRSSRPWRLRTHYVTVDVADTTWARMENEARNLAAWMCWHVRGDMVAAVRITGCEEQTRALLVNQIRQMVSPGHTFARAELYPLPVLVRLPLSTMGHLVASMSTGAAPASVREPGCLGLRRSPLSSLSEAAMSLRTATDVDADLSTAVKARDAARHTISQLSAAVVAHTRFIDQLLAERSTLSACPDSPASLVPPVRS